MRRTRFEIGSPFDALPEVDNPFGLGSGRHCFGGGGGGTKTKKGKAGKGRKAGGRRKKSKGRKAGGVKKRKR